MRGIKRVRMWWQALVSKRRVERELDEEMRFHIDMETEKHARRGVAPDEARRRASLAFGSVEEHKEAMREGRGARGIERVAFDARFAIRQLRKTPGFTVAAVVTLALGIGGNAAVFSVVNGILLRPLAYPEADRLVTIKHRTKGGALPELLPSSSAAHVIYERDSHSFESLALYTGWSGALTGGDARPDWVSVVPAQRSLFDVLRVRPALGRAFTVEEDTPGGPRVAIISDALWRSRYGAEPNVIGRTITLDGMNREVIGVMPAGFAFPSAETQIWIPLKRNLNDLGGFNNSGIARLRVGVTPEQASADLAAVLPRVATLVDFLSLATLRDAGIRPEVRPYIDDVVGRVRPVLWTLWAMMTLVLLIACVNVASLLLVRAEARRREVALRIALGAERGHLLAQALAESTMLLTAGSAVGVGLAWIGIRLLPRLAPSLLPRSGDIQLDGAVVAFTMLVATLVAIVFGIVPVVRNRAVAPSSMLRRSDRASTADRHSGRLRQMLVVAQVAMATVLLVGSGLVLRSFQKLSAVNPGFQADGVLTFRIALPGADYPKPQDRARFHYALLDRLRAIPGVNAAGATGRLPLQGPMTELDPLRVDGLTFPPNALPPIAEMRVATPGYFEAMGIPKLDGRLLERSDTEQQTGAVLITETIAKQVLEGRPAIGARVAHGLAGVSGERAWSDVVGVVGDVRGVSLDQEPTGAIYYAMVNREGVGMDWLAESMVYAVRSTMPPGTLVNSVRRELAQMDPKIPLAETQLLSEVVDRARSGMRFSMIGFAVAAVIGLFMGAIGLYGVLSYVTAQRTREIGVRMALGATPSSVRVGVLRRGLGVSAVGLAIGLVAAVALRRMATPMLYGVTPTDPVTMVAVAGVLLAVGAVATWLPARRAARLDPVRALRWE